MEEKKSNRFAKALLYTLVTGLFINTAYGRFIEPIVTAVAVPDVINRPLHDAQTILHNGQLDDSVTWIDGGVKDLVVEQSPRAGVKMHLNAPVKLWVQIGTANDLAPLTSPQGQQLAVRRVTIPTEYPIAAKLTQALHFDARSTSQTVEAELAEPIEIGGEVLAARGSVVTLDAFPLHHGPFSAVQLALRECHQVDQRTLLVRTAKIERDSGVGYGSLAMIVLMVTVLGLFAGLFVWVCGLFVGFFVTPDIVCIPVAFIFLVIGLFVSIAVMGSNAVDVSAGTVLHFQVTDSTIVNLITGL